MILGVSPGYPGAGRVLSELALAFPQNVKFFELRQPGTLAALSPKPDTLILAGWHPDYLGLVNTLKPGKVICCWTSPIIQSEYTPVEFEYMQTIVKLLDEGKLYALWTGAKEWLSVMGTGRRAFYCPYPLTLPTAWKTDAPRNPPKDVSLFGPLSPRKNVAVQAFAAAKAGCTLHTTDEGAHSLLDSLGLRVPPVYHGWQIPSRYHDLVCSVDVGLQCSVPGAESQSYVAWDHVSRGVPCLSTVEWIDDVTSFGHSLFVRYPFDIDHLVERVQLAASSLPDDLRSRAEEFAKTRNKTVKATLETELGLKL